MSRSVISADGTTIAYDEVGSGPRLILVDAAGHYRGFSSFAGLVEVRLANDFTVFTSTGAVVVRAPTPSRTPSSTRSTTSPH